MKSVVEYVEKMVHNGNSPHASKADASSAALKNTRLNVKIEGDSAPCGYVMANPEISLVVLRQLISAELDIAMHEFGFLCSDAPLSSKQEAAHYLKEFLPTILLRKLRTPRDPAEAESPEADEDKSDLVATSFVFVVEKVKNRCTKQMDDKLFVFVKSEELKCELRKFTDSEVLYDSQPKIDTALFLPIMSRLKDSKKPSYADETVWVKFIERLENEFDDVCRRCENMLAVGEISFNTLWYPFKKGIKVCGPIGQDVVGMEIDKADYNRGWFHQSFDITGTLIRTDGSFFYRCQETLSFPFFEGTRKLADLAIRVMDPDTEEKLKERGRIFKEIGIGAHYRHYTANLIRQSWYGTQLLKAQGRVMIDGRNFKLFNPNYSYFARGVEQDNKLKELPDELLYMCFHSVAGFSFACKKWGELLVSSIGAISFDFQAFERLVLDVKKKDLIKALVSNTGQTFSDIISGKGGGCIFLLHGTPGTGKTLTAEAISELLRRPLYSISVGELGTGTVDLENKLREILDMAQAWNAVVLIDEADIFLEARTLTDIHRNAMVGIFLRLLEYHQGVLFLTTNRVSSFDPAFHSRISVALQYAPLDQSARCEVWRNLLSAAGITHIDPVPLAEHELNGRQIKNTIRLAQSLAVSAGRDVTPEDLGVTIAVSRQFETELITSKPSDAKDSAHDFPVKHKSSEMRECCAKRCCDGLSA